MKILSAEDVINEPIPEEVVEGVFTKGRTTVVVAESGTGKTFLMISLASAISGGHDWIDRKVTQGSVVLVHFEGDQMGKRLEAMKQEGGDISNVYLLRAKGSLSPVTERNTGQENPSELETKITREMHILSQELSENGKPPIVLVGFDTLRASMSGSEDSSENTAAYIRAVARIATTANPDAAVAIVHHAGWPTEGRQVRERGSSAIRGNVDGTVILKPGKQDADLTAKGSVALILETGKLRDEAKPEALNLVRRKVLLPKIDSHGKQISSCVVESQQPVEHLRRMRLLLTLADHAALSNKEDLAKILGLSKEMTVSVFNAAVDGGFVHPPVKQQPYRLTAKGLSMLNIPEEPGI